MTRCTGLLWSGIGLLVLCPNAAAEYFSFRVQQGSTLASATESTVVTVAAEAPGRAVLASVTATYSGSSSALVSNLAMGGSGDFSLATLPGLPVVLATGQSLSFVVRFQPSSTGTAFAHATIYFTDSTGPKAANLLLAGTIPELTLGYITEPGKNYVPLSSGGTLTFPGTSINSSLTLTVVISNRGATSGAVSAISVSGTSFQATGLPAMPVVLDVGKEMRIGVMFSPRQTGTHAGTLAVTCTGRSYVLQIAGTTSAPEFTVGYVLPADNNLITLTSGAVIAFPDTKVNGTSSAVVVVSNRGTGGGYATSISITGRGFQLSGVGYLPVFVEAGKELRFGLVFSPSEIGSASGALRIVIDGRAFEALLDGKGTGSRLAYEVVGNASVTAFYPGGIVSFPDAPLSETSSIAVQVRNTGNAESTIPTIAVAGDGFKLSRTPILPYSVLPDTAVSFEVTFTPVRPGTANGRLRIGSDSFELVAYARGARLSYSYESGSGEVGLLDGRTVMWEPVQIGGNAQLQFIVRNTGTGSATLSTIGIAEAKSAFSLINSPSLPAVINANTALRFSILFSPGAVGDNAAHLRVGTETFTLIGTGAAPPPLPQVELRGPAVVQSTLQQPALSLGLSSPYPLPLSGTLTLTVNSSSFSVDPAVQFATGGRTVAFAIPANETEARFPTGSDVRFQTGSIAGTIRFTAALTTISGINLTPENPPALEIAVPAAPPQVLDVQLESASANTFAIVVTGLATTRSLSQLELQFSSSPRYNVPNGTFALNIAPAASTWYRSAQSQAYGSLFSVSIPFSFQGGAKELRDVVQSVGATLINEQGRSNTLNATPLP